MLGLFPRLMIVVGIGMTAACQPQGYQQNPYQQNPYQQGPYQGPYQQNPYQQPVYNTNNQRSGYTTVTVTNRGQGGNPDRVVQQQVPCGSQYYDGYRQQRARC